VIARNFWQVGAVMLILALLGDSSAPLVIRWLPVVALMKIA